MNRNAVAMKKKVFLFLLFFSLLLTVRVCAEEKRTIDVQFFYTTNCRYCIEIKKNYLPQVISQYRDTAIIKVHYFDIAERKNFQLLLTIENQLGDRIRTPAVLVGNKLLIGAQAIKERLVPLIDEYMASPPAPPLGTPPLKAVDLLEKFRSFSPFAIIAAGLVDGINPCAFTVIIFFISFLSLMGYTKTDVGIIGGAFIFSVFITYLAIGCGLFQGFYQLKQFYSFLRITYFIIAGFCFIVAYLNLRDFFVYTKTKNPDALKVKLPKPIRARINKILTTFYRKDKKDASRSRIALLTSALLVGFLVSLLEAVCTGQVYLPTIVFILKEPTLRMRAIAYLLLYNLMFIVPLLVILGVAVLGTSSEKIEHFLKKRIGLIKIFMFALFLALGVFLLMGV